MVDSTLKSTEEAVAFGFKTCVGGGTTLAEGSKSEGHLS